MINEATCLSHQLVLSTSQQSGGKTKMSSYSEHLSFTEPIEPNADKSSTSDFCMLLKGAVKV